MKRSKSERRQSESSPLENPDSLSTTKRTSTQLHLAPGFSDDRGNFTVDPESPAYARVARFLDVYVPHKAKPQLITELILRNREKMEELFRGLEKKYGPEPLPARGPLLTESTPPNEAPRRIRDRIAQARITFLDRKSCIAWGKNIQVVSSGKHAHATKVGSRDGWCASAVLLDVAHPSLQPEFQSVERMKFSFYVKPPPLGEGMLSSVSTSTQSVLFPSVLAGVCDEEYNLDGDREFLKHHGCAMFDVIDATAYVNGRPALNTLASSVIPSLDTNFSQTLITVVFGVKSGNLALFYGQKRIGLVKTRFSREIPLYAVIEIYNKQARVLPQGGKRSETAE